MWGKGCLKDILLATDKFFGHLDVATAPAAPSASVEDSRVIAKNQENTQGCVGCSIAQAIRLSRMKMGQYCPELSNMAIYRTARNIDGTKEDIGTYLRSGIEAVQKVGAPGEAYWPQNAAKVNEQIPFGAAHDGFDLGGIRHYYRVTSVDEVRRAISAGFAVVGGWQVTQSFEDWDGKGLTPNTGEILGGHALPIVSYDVDGTFRILNSWGTGWGQNGYAHVTDSFVDSGSDLWAIDLV